MNKLLRVAAIEFAFFQKSNQEAQHKNCGAHTQSYKDELHS
jgi:hypothetical protein